MRYELTASKHVKGTRNEYSQPIVETYRADHRWMAENRAAGLRRRGFRVAIRPIDG